MQRTYLITGATSGIGRAMAEQLVGRGDLVIGTGRRDAVLQRMDAELGGRFTPVIMDVRDIDATQATIESLLDERTIDVAVLNAGVSSRGDDVLDPERDVETMTVNGLAFVAQAAQLMREFLLRGHGHLVGMGSVAGRLSNPNAAAYCASKAMVSNYLRSMRLLAHGRGVAVTELRPGYIRTPMIDEARHPFWVIDVERGAELLIRAIDRERRIAYVPARWALVGMAVRFFPDVMLRRLR
jgi:short-subunit dehydrogenase